jgi:inorganic pyrophosphatase
VISAKQTQDGETETNDRLLGVAIHSYDHEHVRTIGDANKTVLAQVEAFFISYNKQRGKQFKVTGREGPEEALKVLKKGIKTFSKKKE